MKVHPEHIYVETFSRCDGSSCCSMFTISTYLPYKNITVQALIETFCSLWSQNITGHNIVLVKSAKLRKWAFFAIIDFFDEISPLYNNLAN